MTILDVGSEEIFLICHYNYKEMHHWEPPSAVSTKASAKQWRCDAEVVWNNVLSFEATEMIRSVLKGVFLLVMKNIFIKLSQE